MAMPINLFLTNTKLTRVFACLILINFGPSHFLTGMNLEIFGLLNLFYTAFSDVSIPDLFYLGHTSN